MPNIKQVTIADSCVLCGLCEQEQFKGAIELGNDWKPRVLNNGMIDLDQYPELMDIVDQCPPHALQVQPVEITEGSGSEILQKLNDHIFKKCRDYSFAPPDEDEYRYETNKYTNAVSKIPVQYRSERKYFTDDSAEEAGFQAFKKAIWSQRTMIAKQYIAAYKVKKLKRYFEYQESNDNYYWKKSRELHDLLSEAYQLAIQATHGKIKLPQDFSEIQTRPEWGYDGKIYKEMYEMLEDCQYDYEAARSFYALDSYRVYINTDGDDRCYYDLSEAEEELRKDIDNIVDDVIAPFAKDRVETVTTDYLKHLKKEFDAKLNLLQSALKSCVDASSLVSLHDALQRVIEEIRATQPPTISVPYPDIDTAYNSDYRFYSESSCEEAAESRRERAHREGVRYIQHLPQTVNDAYMQSIAKIITQWKRSLIGAYDICGKAYPMQELTVKVGSESVVICARHTSAHSQTAPSSACGPFDEVSEAQDQGIKTYIESSILNYGTSVKNVKYVRESKCEISIHVDYDLKETLFGGLREVNHRWGYMLSSISDFRSSAYDVAKACIAAFSSSVFWKNYFDNVKESMIQEVKKLDKH